jgi:restriction system protein
MPSVPSFDELMWPTLRALKTIGGSGTNEELLSKIIEQERIPAEIHAVEHSDRRKTKLKYNLTRAKTYLKKARAIDNRSWGSWSITAFGESLTEADVQLIPSRIRKQRAIDCFGGPHFGE